LPSNAFASERSNQVACNDLVGAHTGAPERAAVDKLRDLPVNLKLLRRPASRARTPTPSARFGSKPTVSRRLQRLLRQRSMTCGFTRLSPRMWWARLRLFGIIGSKVVALIEHYFEPVGNANRVVLRSSLFADIIS
jgi:hypothetical protein